MCPPRAMGTSGKLCAGGGRARVCVHLGCTLSVCAREGMYEKYARGCVRWEDLTRLVCVYAHVSTDVHASAWVESGCALDSRHPRVGSCEPRRNAWLRLRVSECVSELGASVEMCGNVNKPLEVEAEGLPMPGFGLDLGVCEFARCSWLQGVQACAPAAGGGGGLSETLVYAEVGR